MTRRCFCWAQLLLLAAVTAALAASASETTVLPAGVDAETGYRMGRYRAPVPDSLPGGQVLDTDAVHQQLGTELVFIDVYPPKGLGPDPLSGVWLSNEKHQNIEGSVWLPEVGRGHLEPDYENYFRRNLERLTAHSLATPLLFYCTSDCWQAWNAARRAINWGYQHVYWYPAGIDGWREAGHVLVKASPVNFLQRQASIYLQSADGKNLLIGNVQYGDSDNGSRGFNVTIDSERFNDHFLSMRPFRCIESDTEWFCYLPYPYALRNIISDNDLTDLEYNLLFMRKTPAEFGIDAWNGLYYKLEQQHNGELHGTLYEGDLNVLQSPTANAYDRPIDLDEFIPASKDKCLFPTLLIR